MCVCVCRTEKKKLIPCDTVGVPVRACVRACVWCGGGGGGSDDKSHAHAQRRGRTAVASWTMDGPAARGIGEAAPADAFSAIKKNK